MPSYKVRMLRERIEYVDLYIDSAEDEEEAEGMAQAQACSYGVDWEPSTDSGRPYVAEGETELLYEEDA